MAQAAEFFLIQNKETGFPQSNYYDTDFVDDARSQAISSHCTDAILKGSSSFCWRVRCASEPHSKYLGFLIVLFLFLLKLHLILTAMHINDSLQNNVVIFYRQTFKRRNHTYPILNLVVNKDLNEVVWNSLISLIVLPNSIRDWLWGYLKRN